MNFIHPPPMNGEDRWFVYSEDLDEALVFDDYWPARAAALAKPAFADEMLLEHTALTQSDVEWIRKAGRRGCVRAKTEDDAERQIRAGLPTVPA